LGEPAVRSTDQYLGIGPQSGNSEAERSLTFPRVTALVQPHPATAADVSTGPLLCTDHPTGNVSLPAVKPTPEKAYLRASGDFVKAYHKSGAQPLVDLFLEPGYLLPVERKPGVSQRDELLSFLSAVDRKLSNTSTPEEKKMSADLLDRTKDLLKAAKDLPSKSPSSLPASEPKQTAIQVSLEKAVAELSKGEQRNLGRVADKVAAQVERFGRVGIPVDRDWLMASHLQETAIRQIQNLDKEIADRGGQPEIEIPGLESAEVSRAKWLGVLAATSGALMSEQ
jgi:hypothetical protein